MKSLVILLLLISSSLQIHAQTTSDATSGNLTEKQVTNLELLGRVWGFLKYYHPAVGSGKYNWDEELIKVLPAYRSLVEDEARDKFLLEWINGLGEVKTCKSCKPAKADAFLKPDFKWIDTRFSAQVKEKLHFIYENRHQGKHHYIAMAGEVGNPEFRNEDAYESTPYPDEVHRLIAVFRYWNMINYFFPYKHLMDDDWNLKLREYIPVFLHATSELDYELAAIQLIGDVQDTHANLHTGADKIYFLRGKYYPPVHTRFIENKLVVTDFYNPEQKNRIGLQTGDIITKINGTSVEQLVKDNAKYYPASNEPTRLRGMSSDMLRSSNRKITISYLREKAAEQTLDLKLYPWDSASIDTWYKQKPESSYKMLDNNIGYVTLGSIAHDDIARIKEKFMNTRGIIIDIRNYPSAFVVFSLGSYFVSKPSTFVKFTRANESNYGEFTMLNYTKIHPNKKRYKGKLVVLVNELTQSAAEYTTMALQAGANTTVVGSTTAAADGNVSPILLPGGLKTWISGIGVYYPDGRETQRIGIVPDVVITPTIEGIRAGKDELLDKAIELILD